jgi:chromosomal replication initiation ATPase DnaA
MSGDEAVEELGQLAFELGHSASDDEADFIVGEGNALAYAHIQAYPHWPSPLTLLTGPAKAGKSHLSRIFAVRSGAEVGDANELEQLSRTDGTSPLVLEDVDRGGYEEASLFHLINQCMRDRRPLLMTARTGVASWPFKTDDLKSRARLAAHFTVTSSDDIQLSQMLAKLFDDRQVAVAPKVIAFIVARMERSPEEAVVLAGMLDRMALLRASAITRTLAAEALALRAAAHAADQLELDLGDQADE